MFTTNFHETSTQSVQFNATKYNYQSVHVNHIIHILTSDHIKNDKLGGVHVSKKDNDRLGGMEKKWREKMFAC
jgi:hypothetical protein